MESTKNCISYALWMSSIALSVTLAVMILCEIFSITPFIIGPISVRRSVRPKLVEGGSADVRARDFFHCFFH